MEPILALIAFFAIVLGCGILLSLPLYVMVRNAQSAALEAWPEVADSLYEEFERQLAILKGEPDPLPGWEVKKAMEVKDGEVRFADGKAWYVLDGVSYCVTVDPHDAPEVIASRFREAARTAKLQAIQSRSVNRSVINFVGGNVTAVDNAAQARTEVTPGVSVIEAQSNLKDNWSSVARAEAALDRALREI